MTNPGAETLLNPLLGTLIGTLIDHGYTDAEILGKCETLVKAIRSALGDTKTISKVVAMSDAVKEHLP